MNPLVRLIGCDFYRFFLGRSLRARDRCPRIDSGDVTMDEVTDAVGRHGYGRTVDRCLNNLIVRRMHRRSPPDLCPSLDRCPDQISPFGPGAVIVGYSWITEKVFEHKPTMA